MVFVDYSTSQEILNKSENNKIANKILMYSGSAESTDLALNKLKELKIDESKYFVEIIDISGGSFFSSINKKLMQPLKESAEDGI